MRIGNVSWNGDEGNLSRALLQWLGEVEPITAMDACDDWIMGLAQAKRRAAKRMAQTVNKERTEHKSTAGFQKRATSGKVL
jgi:hypothetical protein